MHPLIKLYSSNRKAGFFRAATSPAGDSATIYLYDMIVDSEIEAEYWGGVTPRAFIDALNAITAPVIDLRVNSPGGSVFAARAMEQAIRECKSDVIVHVDGVAASAASFLIMPAKQILMAPGAFLMIHKAWTTVSGNADELTKTAGLLGQIDGSLVASYKARANLDETQITDMMAAETWISAPDAVTFGLADEINEGSAPANRVRWDLSAYNNAPQRPPEPTQNHKPDVDRDDLRRAVLKALIPVA